ncbi:MAG: hypothetical protein LQ345_003287 [Seirophora villosa]|nr:MAG: hypothetical protein LQ345_003287 [Seirophora villosa]
MKATTVLPRLSKTLSAPSIPIPIHPRPRNPVLKPRTFVSSSTLNPLQTLTASRILPYPSAALYNLITDISSYPTFLPYCSSATITSTSSPDPTHQKRWPRTADLRVGWGRYNESFRSRIYCLPHHTLEACAGSARPSIPASQLPHYHPDDASEEEPETPDEQQQRQQLFTSLLTRWSLSEFPFKPLPSDGASPQEGAAETNPAHPRTEVSLVIEAQFASAVYSALSQAAAPKVAGMMIEAFEKRAREVLGQGHGVEGAGHEENRGKSVSTEGVVGEEGAKSWNQSH